MKAGRSLLASVVAVVAAACTSGEISEAPAPEGGESAGHSDLAIVGDPILLGVNPAGPMVDFPAAGSPTSLGMARLWDQRVTWGDIEPCAPENGVHDYHWDALDARMAEAIAADMRPMIVLYGTPDWGTKKPECKSPPPAWAKPCTPTYTGSCTTYPDKPELWSEFVAAVAARYVLHRTSKGEGPVYEVWNEPNLNGAKKGDLAYWTGTDAELLDLQKRAYQAVKQAANGTVVCCGWNRRGANDAKSPVDRWLALGGADYVDAISFHPYPSGWDPSKAAETTQLFRAAMARHAVSRPLWATEVGFVNKNGGDPRALSLAEQSDLVTKTILTLRAESVPVVLWYLWNESHPGFADSDYVGLHRVLGDAVEAAGAQANKPKPATCDPAVHPAPSWGEKGGKCLAACGLLGGTVAKASPCAKSGLVDVGEAYDVAYCCTKPAAGACDPKTQPAPEWGMKGGQCLASCDAVGGTSASNEPCAKHGKVDAGKAYDVAYCCFDPAPPPPVCDPVTQPAPAWGTKNGQCLQGCGVLGGTSAFESPCADHGKVDAGAAYDVAYCCKDAGAPPVCDPKTQPAPQWGVKDGKCLGACGVIGGTSAFVTPCSQNGKVDAGAAYDVAYCCKDPPPVCDPNTQPSPQWGEKNGKCLQACGLIGGTSAFVTPCAQNGKVDAGEAYDVAYCCKDPPPTCDPNTQPSPQWGVKNGQCLPCCGCVGGTKAFDSPCGAHGMADAGAAYDVTYCCK
jgi:hypothetical protein